MPAEFDELIGPLLEREGGDEYTNRKHDRGGPTKYGIIQRTFTDWLSANSRPNRDVQTLTHDEAVKIYFDLYWRTAKCQSVPPSVREIHFDASINHGTTRAAKLLQAAAGATQDGAIGPNTLKYAFAMDPMLLLYRYIVMRYRFYGEIIARDDTQMANIDGWMRRMEHFG
jgi:lysozyme family protein